LLDSVQAINRTPIEAPCGSISPVDGSPLGSPIEHRHHVFRWARPTRTSGLVVRTDRALYRTPADQLRLRRLGFPAGHASHRVEHPQAATDSPSTGSGGMPGHRTSRSFLVKSRFLTQALGTAPSHPLGKGSLVVGIVAPTGANLAHGLRRGRTDDGRQRITEPGLCRRHQDVAARWERTGRAW
jgi:hypothetical protein